VPPEAKHLLPYVNRAKELVQHAPLVSFYCHLYVADQLGKLRKAQGDKRELTNMLLQEIEAAEKLKPRIDTSNGQREMETFAIGVFEAADGEDRRGPITDNTVRKFTVAVLFLDVLTQFGELAPDLEEKRRYAKYKATYIRKCLAEGRTPDPGPPMEQADDQHMPGAPTHPLPPPAMPQQPPPTQQQASPSFPPAPSSISPPSSTSEPSVVPPASAPLPPPSDSSNVSAPAVPAATGPAGHLSAKAMQDAQKKAQYAASALSFRDVPTAIENLKEALRLLGAS